MYQMPLKISKSKKKHLTSTTSVLHRDSTQFPPRMQLQMKASDPWRPPKKCRDFTPKSYPFASLVGGWTNQPLWKICIRCYFPYEKVVFSLLLWLHRCYLYSRRFDVCKALFRPSRVIPPTTFPKKSTTPRVPLRESDGFNWSYNEKNFGKKHCFFGRKSSKSSYARHGDG